MGSSLPPQRSFLFYLGLGGLKGHHTSCRVKPQTPAPWRREDSERTPPPPLRPNPGPSLSSLWDLQDPFSLPVSRPTLVGGTNVRPILFGFFLCVFLFFLIFIYFPSTTPALKFRKKGLVWGKVGDFIRNPAQGGRSPSLSKEGKHQHERQVRFSRNRECQRENSNAGSLASWLCSMKPVLQPSGWWWEEEKVGS